MSETSKVLEPLRRVLPEIPGEQLVDECGDHYYRGFNGDCSQCARYVTDGHILLLASAIDPAMMIEKDEDRWVCKSATEAKIDALWKPAEAREDVAAGLLGVAELAGPYDVAVLRDTKGRLMILNAHLLAFGIKAVRADALTVAAAAIPVVLGVFDTPLALRRGGVLVGLLMPMRMDARDVSKFDLAVEPMDLAAVAQA